MREIKFRAWDEGNKVMHFDVQYMKSGDEGNDWICFISDKEKYITDGTKIILNNPFFRQQIHLMQYTGLKDKSGKEIYEGDIVSYFKRLYEVCINFNGYYLQRYKLWRGKFKPSFQYSLSLFTKPSGKVDSAEVIGNIYENPELLNSVRDVQVSDTTDDAQ